MLRRNLLKLLAVIPWVRACDPPPPERWAFNASECIFHNASRSDICLTCVCGTVAIVRPGEKVRLSQFKNGKWLVS